MTLIELIVSQADTLHSLVSDVLAVDQPTVKNPPFIGKFNKLLGWFMWGATTACMVGVIITGARMAIAYRGGNDANVSQLGYILFGCILVGTAAQIVNAFV